MHASALSARIPVLALCVEKRIICNKCHTDSRRFRQLVLVSVLHAVPAGAAGEGHLVAVAVRLAGAQGGFYDGVDACHLAGAPHELRDLRTQALSMAGSQGPGKLCGGFRH